MTSLVEFFRPDNSKSSYSGNRVFGDCTRAEVP